MYVCITAFNPGSLKAQSYSNDITINCPGCPENPILIRVNRTITLNNLECGEYNISATFTIIKGASCVNSITNIRWYNGWEYVDDRPNQTFHLHSGGSIDLIFKVKTICGDFQKSITWTAPPNNTPCDGCFNTYSYSSFYEGGPYEFVWNPITQKWEKKYVPVNPKLVGITIFKPGDSEIINDNNNYGIFHFPYYMHVSDQCVYPPNLYDFVFDFNRFADLAQTGIGEYSHLYGHAKLIDNSTNFNPAYPDKIYVQFEDMGFYVFNLVFDYLGFDSGTCTSTGILWNNQYHAFADKKHFPYSYDCGIWNLPPGNSIYGNSILSANYKSEISNDFIIFPTIVSDQFTITCDKFSEIEYFADIYNSNGKIVMQKALSEKTNSFNISDLAKGIYFIRITDKNRLVSVKKIIKD